MQTDLTRLIESYARLAVLVIGDAILDSYLDGAALRFCREAPVPNVTVTGRSDAPGGAANTAANVAALGARAVFLTAAGDDGEAARLCAALARHGVADDHVTRQAGRRTRAKHRITADAQLLLSYDWGDTDAIDAAAEERLVSQLAQQYPRADAVIVSDYGYGAITPRILDALAALQAKHPRTLVVDSRHRLAAFRRLNPTAVKPNFEELRGLLAPADADPADDRPRYATRHAAQILARTGADLAAVTLDRDGAVLLERGRAPHRIFARPARVTCAAGAGDTYVAALALTLAQGAAPAVAGELAAAAAAVVISQERTGCCTAAALRDMFGPTDKITALERLVEHVRCYRQQGRRVVFTNGCFDILHRGHVTLLEQSKSLGDVLIVGVNGDASIRRLKGPTRPINTLDDRLQVLAALRCVDHVVAFDEDTSCNLVRALRPHVFVKGGDYTRETLPEAPLVEALGGRVHVLPYLDDRSTSGLIDRIRAPAHAAAGY